MQRISISDSINRRINREHEKHRVGDVASAGGDAGDHLAAGQGLDEDEVGHDGEDVVVGGEGGQPVDGEVVGPDEEDGDVDGEDPDHEDEDRVGVVIEIMVGAGSLRFFIRMVLGFWELCVWDLRFRELSATPACMLIVVQVRRLSMRTDME